MSKRIGQNKVINFDEILYPEIKIMQLENEIAVIKKNLSIKEQQSGKRKKIIEEQARVIKKLTGINTLLEDENKSINLLKGILDNVPKGKITYKNNVELVEQCLIEANKNFVLLCEGSRNSLDYNVYTKIYTNGLIIPYGGWNNIELILKGYRSKVNWIYAILDNDKRGERIKDALIYEGIFCLNVRAVENLMFVDDIFVKILTELEIEKPLECLKILKEEAMKSYIEIEEKYNPTFEDILLCYPPKKIMGLAIRVFENNKLSRYKECFIKNLDDSDVINNIKKYTPIILTENVISIEKIKWSSKND